MDTTDLRRQHDAAALLVGQINRLIEAVSEVPGQDQAYQLTMLLAKLSGTLRVHFAQEDKQLYPLLITSGHARVAATARRFFDEMGQIGPAYSAYSSKWRSYDAIVKDWADFKKETKAIFAALADRIHRENSELYPLADQFGRDVPPGRAA